MVETQFSPARDRIIMTFAPIFRKSLEWLEQRGLSGTSKAENLRETLERIPPAQVKAFAAS